MKYKIKFKGLDNGNSDAADRWFKLREDADKLKRAIIKRLEDLGYKYHQGGSNNMQFRQKFTNSHGEDYWFVIWVDTVKFQISKQVGEIKHSTFLGSSTTRFTVDELEFFDRLDFSFMKSFADYNEQDISDWV